MHALESEKTLLRTLRCLIRGCFLLEGTRGVPRNGGRKCQLV